MVDFAIHAIEQVLLDGPSDLMAMDFMSPYVWRGDGSVFHSRPGLQMLVRAVPRDGVPSGLIWAGCSEDGLRFLMEPTPAITPGPEAVDEAGVEDPTVYIDEHGCLVFFTGVDKNGQGSMLVAEGPDELHLSKRAVALRAPEGEGNIKEATLARASDGTWRLFYEYARNNASRIGLAVSETPRGPWISVADPFDIREDGWDNWHLSTGPILDRPGMDPVMFYNGATVDARWRIGWISFSPDYRTVSDRGIEPLIMPPPPKDRTATDIAFAASLVDGPDGPFLYYSLEDRTLRRARIKVY